MYFSPNMTQALVAGRELLDMFTAGEIANNPIKAADIALFIAGTVNAFFANEDVTIRRGSDLRTADLVTVLDRTIPSAPTVNTQVTIDWRMLYELAKRIICSL